MKIGAEAPTLSNQNFRATASSTFRRSRFLALSKIDPIVSGSCRKALKHQSRRQSLNCVQQPPALRSPAKQQWFVERLTHLV